MHFSPLSTAARALTGILSNVDS
eukprot:COSAG02_NODE_52707_length_306_cov_0.748792_1_plen_22_part_10